jgi:hypothetical protein
MIFFWPWEIGLFMSPFTRGLGLVSADYFPISLVCFDGTRWQKGLDLQGRRKGVESIQAHVHARVGSFSATAKFHVCHDWMNVFYSS